MNENTQLKNGYDIHKAIKEAKLLAEAQERVINFLFNGVVIKVASDSNEDLLLRDYDRAFIQSIDPVVGPYPNVELTAHEKENDALMKDMIHQKRIKDELLVKEEMENAKKTLEQRLVNAPAIVLADQSRWEEYKKNNQDSIGLAIHQFAENWARLMQLEMAQGKTLEQTAKETADAADIKNISGSQYLFATQVLIQCWQYGEDLREWHEKKYKKTAN